MSPEPTMAMHGGNQGAEDADSRQRSQSEGGGFKTDKDLYGGLIRVHILHHAVEQPIFGLGIIEELRRHGYEISAGTVYPMLHVLERKGYLTSRSERSGRRERRVYQATPAGRAALAAAKVKIKELFGELFQDGD